MPAPTFVAEYETPNWLVAGSTKSVSVTTQVGDILVWCCVTRDAGTTISTLSAGTGMTWSFPAYSLVASTTAVYAGVATAAATETFTLTATAVSGGTIGHWGFNVLRFAASNGIGAAVNNTAPGSGAPTLNITTTQTNSAVVVVNGDWNAVDGSSRVWRTGAGALTEQSYARAAIDYAAYVGYHADAGAIGTKAVGLSAPTGQKYAICAVEVLGTPTKAPVIFPSQYGGFH